MTAACTSGLAKKPRRNYSFVGRVAPRKQFRTWAQTSWLRFGKGPESFVSRSFARDSLWLQTRRKNVETRQLGNSDMKISVLGIGAWAIGGGGWLGSMGPQNDDDSVPAIHTALDHGINWIDTAALYGLGHSEEMVARALQGRTPRPYIFTKCERVWDEKGRVGASLKAES